MKKVMVASCRHLLFSFSFFLLWSFWSNSLGLIINNEMVVFLMLIAIMARGKRLKKGCDDLEVQKQNVASLKQIIGKQMLIHYDKDLGNKLLLH
jgi:hypothetical protein